MGSRSRRTETWILAAIFIFLALCAGLSLYSSVFGTLWSSLWKKKNASASLVFAVYAILFAGAAWASLIQQRKNEGTFLRFCANGFTAFVKETLRFIAWIIEPLQDNKSYRFLFSITAIALGLRAYALSIPIRFDEGLTFLNFVNGDFMDLFFYPEPNNHVFHTLLVKISVVIFGDNPIAIRLPAYVAGLCTIPLTFSLFRRLVPVDGGRLSSALVAVFPYLVLYGAMARGYTLVLFFALALVSSGLYFLSRPSSARCGIISLITALGIFTMLSFLFPAAGIILWITALLFISGWGSRIVLKDFILPYAVATAVLCVICYTPTIMATQWMHSPVLTTMSWQTFLGRLPGHLANTASAFLRDVPVALTGTLILLLVVGLYDAARNRRWGALLLLPCFAVAAAIILLTKRIIPFERTWIYLLPFLFILADLGLMTIVRRSKVFVRFLPVALAVFTLYWAMNQAGNNTIARYSDVGLFTEAPIVVEYLSQQMRPGDLMVAKVPANVPVCYYMLQRGVPRFDKAASSRAPRTFFIVQKSVYSLRDMTKKHCEKLLEIGDAVVYTATSTSDHN